MTEEVTGVDLVREQFRIADGEALTFDDPEPRGHSFEFRINGEDPGRGFLPAPGTVTDLRRPERPGVRVDTGVESGSVIGGAFDSLLAKLIVTGATRQEALERSRRALDELQVEGMATLLPFHRTVVRDAAFTQRAVHRAQPLDRDRVRQRPPAVRRRRRGRRRRRAARDRRRRGRRPAPRGVAARRPRRVGGGPAREAGRAEALGARRPSAAAASGDTPDLADAGHDRQGRRRGRRGRRGRRPRRRARGHEDGAADQRPQGRHRQAA